MMFQPDLNRICSSSNASLSITSRARAVITLCHGHPGEIEKKGVLCSTLLGERIRNDQLRGFRSLPKLD